MEGIKYVNLIEMCMVVIEIQRVENSKLVVSVNNTFVRHTTSLAADARPCVLITKMFSTTKYLKVLQPKVKTTKVN